MSLSRRSRRTRRPLLALAAVIGLAGSGLAPTAPATAAPAPEIRDVVDRYQQARSELADRTAAVDAADARRRDGLGELVAARQAVADADAALVDQRGRYATLSAEYFMRQGAKDDTANESMQLAMSGTREALDRTKAAQAAAHEALDGAEGAFSAAEEARAHAEEARGAAQASADEVRATADQALAATGATDLPVLAYVAYLDAAAAANAAHPRCGLTASVLAGVGRISSGHGRNLGSGGPQHDGEVEPVLRGLRGDPAADTDGGTLDGDPGRDRAVGPMQLTPAQWASWGTDGDGDGRADPDDVFDASATVATALCGSASTLEQFGPLHDAVGVVLGADQGQQVLAALGAARRYSLTPELDMGSIPIDPQAALGDGSPQFDISDTDMAQGDVAAMIEWALSRVGTPYSQCLGPDARPQDPVCPPGTNRFGAGYFDCSGFVSSAYRRIGIAVPATTYAMEADPRFMSTMVSTRIDLSVMKPGDVFLMDGHTGMYVGGGMIIHAIGAGLTYQPIPRWVVNGTFAVLRPLSILGMDPSAPLPPLRIRPVDPTGYTPPPTEAAPALPSLPALPELPAFPLPAEEPPASVPPAGPPATVSPAAPAAPGAAATASGAGPTSGASPGGGPTG